jgi:hypothetical protein
MELARDCLDKGNLTIDGIRFHIIQNDDFIEGNDVINVVIGVQITEKIQAAMLSGCRVFLIHDEIMLSKLITNQLNAKIENPVEKPEKVNLVKWMTRECDPLTEEIFSETDLLYLLNSEQCPGYINDFLGHDSCIQ